MGKKNQKSKDSQKPPKAKNKKNIKRNKRVYIRKVVKFIKKANNQKRKFEVKKIAVSYRKLSKIIDKENIKNAPLEKLKIICSNFDINPDFNFKLLSNLKRTDRAEYNKYIDKYKYTLNYSDAKKLGCFPNVEKDTLKELKVYCKDEISNVKSLAKIKLFSFLFYINNLQFKFNYLDDGYYDEKLQQIKEKIISYSTDKDLVFKIPNNYGNYELQYYSYLDLYVNYFFKKLSPKKNVDDDESNNSEENNSQLNELFFDWDKRSFGTTEKVDVTEFENNKNKLKIFIKKHINKTKKNDISAQMMEIEKIKDENYTKDKNNYKTNNVNEEENSRKLLINFSDRHIKKLKKYDKELYFLFKQETNEEIIIKKIEFIYCNLLFTKEGCELYDYYPNCLLNDPSIRNENHNDKLENFAREISKDSEKKDELVFYNLDSFFMDKIDNPFCNTAKYYRYPTLLKKNIFQANEEIFKDFKESLKEIYKSKLLEEIFYLTPEFKDYKYPLKDEEILDEMIENTIFLPYDQEVLHGYTQKQFSKIYISSNIFKNNYSRKDISKIVVDISFLFNTLIHEQLKHYIKALLSYNSFRFRQKKRLDSDLSSYEQERFLIDNIQNIFSQDKRIITKPVKDGGNIAEIYLYGSILYKLSFVEALNFHNKLTWNLSVLEHLKLFSKNNKPSLENKSEKLENIIKNKTLSKFIKNIFSQFNKYYKCDGVFDFDYNIFISKKSNEDPYPIGKDSLLFDYSVYLENTIITAPDTGTIKNVQHLLRK